MIEQVTSLTQECEDLKCLTQNGCSKRYREIEVAVSRLSTILINKEGEIPDSIRKHTLLKKLLESNAPNNETKLELQ